MMDTNCGGAPSMAILGVHEVVITFYSYVCVAGWGVRESTKDANTISTIKLLRGYDVCNLTILWKSYVHN